MDVPTFLSKSEGVIQSVEFLEQDAQCETAGKLSQSIYVVESLLGKCHEENDLLFFTIRYAHQSSSQFL